MKYRKPSRDLRVDQNYSFVWECFRFVESLPDEFEIVPEGYVCVKWPDDLTRDYLKELADYVGKGTPRIGTLSALLGLASIAPERKKRRVAVWIGRDGNPYCAPADENHGIAADSTIIDL